MYNISQKGLQEAPNVALAKISSPSAVHSRGFPCGPPMSVYDMLSLHASAISLPQTQQLYIENCCWVAGPGAETAGGACSVSFDGWDGDSRLPFRATDL